ncbi:MAG: DsbA family protein [Candidatus Peregrinibacteria bacterium]|nr:DsbA family protein [Candidatus Peregrinibacteria bacterium]MDZ4245081.1 DsbA family protein [Candidatus Gracilibacteria bacterium]
MRNTKFILISLLCVLALSACSQGTEAPTSEESLTDRGKMQDIIKGLSETDVPTEEAQSTFEEESRIAINIDENPILGDLNAPVTIIEFSDFQCPVCEQFHRETGKKIKEQYIDTGKVKLVYRDFPIYNIHEYAISAAKAGECAYEQGKFWEMHNYLFENQYSWQNADVKTILTNAAGKLGINTEQFAICFDADSTLEKIGFDFYTGKSLKVNGTPTFFINGKMVVGFRNFTEMSELIEAELK